MLRTKVLNCGYRHKCDCGCGCWDCKYCNCYNACNIMKEITRNYNKIKIEKPLKSINFKSNTIMLLKAKSLLVESLVMISPEGPLYDRN